MDGELWTHNSVIRLLPVTELAQEIVQNMEVYIIVYIMSVSKTTELWTFSKAHFSLLHYSDQLGRSFELCIVCCFF